MVDHHGEIMGALGEIKGQLVGIVATTVRQRKDHEDLEVRTRVLENWRWYLVGLFSLGTLGAVYGFVFL